MNTNYAFWRSKTFWTVVVSFIVGGTNTIKPMLPAGGDTFILAVLGMVATYFHVSGVKIAAKLGHASN